MVKTRMGKKLNRFERSMMIFRGDRKTLSSKVAFGMNMLLTALCGTGVAVIASQASYDKEVKPTDVAAGAAFGLFGYIQASEVYRKSGTDYWWVEEKGSARKRRAKK